MIGELLPAAYFFLQEQVAEFAKTQNTKLAFRYALLQRYFEKYLPVWQDEPVTEKEVAGKQAD